MTKCKEIILTKEVLEIERKTERFRNDAVR